MCAGLGNLCRAGKSLQGWEISAGLGNVCRAGKCVQALPALPSLALALAFPFFHHSASPRLGGSSGCVCSSRNDPNSCTWCTDRDSRLGRLGKPPRNIQKSPGMNSQHAGEGEIGKEILAFCCLLGKQGPAFPALGTDSCRASLLSQICAVCLEEFKPKDELGICPCKHAFHRKCLIKWLEVRKVCPLCNMPVLQLAQLHGKPDPGPPQGPLPGSQNIV
uniref:RING-type domain-containing protein n=1 Tax=Malurus cyaneus samueli TaxID=2593467 RepID=A0A8C5T967_9PASS